MCEQTGCASRDDEIRHSGWVSGRIAQDMAILRASACELGMHLPRRLLIREAVTAPASTRATEDFPAPGGPVDQKRTHPQSVLDAPGSGTY